MPLSWRRMEKKGESEEKQISKFSVSGATLPT
jgi:hypothetical protein